MIDLPRNILKFDSFTFCKFNRASTKILIVYLKLCDAHHLFDIAINTRIISTCDAPTIKHEGGSNLPNNFKVNLLENFRFDNFKASRFEPSLDEEI